MGNGPSAPQGGIAIGRTAAEAYAFALRHWRVLVAMGALPMLASSAVELAAINLSFATGSVLWIFSGQLIILVILSSFAVSWHRYTLLGEKPPNLPFYIAFGPREGRYFLYVLLISLPVGIATALYAMLLLQAREQAGGSLLMLLALAVVIVGLVVGVRLSLVFPAIAVDGGHDVKQAWNLTKGHGWRLFFLTLLMLLPAKLLSELILASTIVGGIAGLLLGLLGITVEFVGIAALITAISAVFRQTAGWLLPNRPPA